MTDRERTRQLAQEFQQRGSPLGWFEALYQEAEGRAEAIPWADLTPNDTMVSWLDRQPALTGRRALVVGCGLGDDAEHLALRGGRVTAFDLAPTAIAWCRRRFPQSPVEYVVADLLGLPDSWQRQFDLLVEINTLQAMPRELRPAACRALAECLAPGGDVLVICRARDEEEEVSGPPWPLARSELADLLAAGLTERQFRDFLDDESPAVRRFEAVYHRSAKP